MGKVFMFLDARDGEKLQEYKLPHKYSKFPLDTLPIPVI